jgi:hypothetical protein
MSSIGCTAEGDLLKKKIALMMTLLQYGQARRFLGDTSKIK